MSDPEPIPGRRQPARAEPMQPDRPTRGHDAVNAQHDGDDAADTDSVKRRKEQSETALSNVSQDYGGADK